MIIGKPAREAVSPAPYLEKTCRARVSLQCHEGESFIGRVCGMQPASLALCPSCMHCLHCLAFPRGLLANCWSLEMALKSELLGVVEVLIPELCR